MPTYVNWLRKRRPHEALHELLVVLNLNLAALCKFKIQTLDPDEKPGMYLPSLELGLRRYFAVVLKGLRKQRL